MNLINHSNFVRAQCLHSRDCMTNVYAHLPVVGTGLGMFLVVVTRSACVGWRQSGAWDWECLYLSVLKQREAEEEGEDVCLVVGVGAAVGAAVSTMALDGTTS